MTNDGNGTHKSHWLVEAFGGVNIVVAGGVLLTAGFYVSEIGAGQKRLAEKVETLETQLQRLDDRDTEIERLGWRLENLHSNQNDTGIKLESLQEQIRALQAAVRDINRAIEQ